MTEHSIPFDIAFDFCKKYREKHKVRMFSQCWGCIRFSRGNPEKMCFFKPPSNEGCEFVNQLYEETIKALLQ